MDQWLDQLCFANAPYDHYVLYLYNATIQLEWLITEPGTDGQSKRKNTMWIKSVLSRTFIFHDFKIPMHTIMHPYLG